MAIEIPDLPLPRGVGAIYTTRTGGHSVSPYDSFNTAQHVGDDSELVEKNRALMCAAIGYPVQWMQQVHGVTVAKIEKLESEPVADSLTTMQPGLACAVQTADCLPLLMCDEAATQVAVVHAGWRGLVNGIISRTLASFTSSPKKIRVWMGPAISIEHFEVGDEVYSAFEGWSNKLSLRKSDLNSAFKSGANSLYADLYQLARLECESTGVTQVWGGEYCTWKNADRFYSYRRGGATGRMSSAIWINT